MTTAPPAQPIAAPAPAPTLTAYHDGRVAVWGGDCLALLASLPPDSVDSIVTDPPYGLGFMGKKWDDLPPGKEWAEACYRVLKPGGHLLAFGGTRTWHRLAVAIEDGGFEIRDSLAWLYGSGFPKSMDVSKAIDGHVTKGRSDSLSLAEVNAERPGEATVRVSSTNGHRGLVGSEAEGPREKRATPATPEAEQWQGWGTAMKPAFEPIVVGRKPLAAKTVAANVLAHGTGALNIDGCRIGNEVRLNAPAGNKPGGASYNMSVVGMPEAQGQEATGRWPANVILDESQAEALDRQAAPSTSRKGKPRGSAAPGEGWGMTATGAEYDDQGGPSRFFYCAKAPKSERPVLVLEDGTKLAHPTVKPLAVMRWLVKLVTPPDGLVVDTFAGTGTTGEACVLEGFRCLLAEDPTKGEQDYLPLIDLRLTRAIEKAAAAALPVEKQETVA